VPNGGHHRESQHDQRHVPVPPVPGAAFIVIKAKFSFGGLEAVLDGPAMAFDGGQRFDAGPGRATMC